MGDAVLEDGRADRDRRVGIAGEVEVADDAAVGAAARHLELTDDLHGAQLRRSRQGARREARHRHVQARDAGPDDPGDGGLEVHDVRIAADVHEPGDGDGARHADTAEVVASEVDEHEVFGALLLVGEQLIGQAAVLGLVPAPRAGAGDRVGRRDPVLDGDEGLGAGADQVEARQAQQEEIGAGVRDAQLAVDVEGRGGDRHVEALGGHHLEDVAGPHVLLGLLDEPLELPRSTLVLDHGRGDLACRREHRRTRRAQPGGHRPDAPHGIRPGPLGALRAVVVVDGIGDEPDLAAVVVEDGHVRGEHHDHVGHAQVVGQGLAQGRLLLALHVIAEIADHTGAERRQRGVGGGVEGIQGLAEHGQRGPAGGQPGDRTAEPTTAPRRADEDRGAVDADERPSRPDAALDRLEQEAALAAPGELLVEGDRGEVVGAQPGVDADDAPPARLGDELIAAGEDRQLGAHAAPSAAGPSGGVRSSDPSTSGSGPPVSKQDSAPVWQAPPTWSTRRRIVSPSQSSRASHTYCV